MSRALVCLVAFFSLAWARQAPAQTPPPAQPARDRPVEVATGTASIRGRVVEATTGRGLSRVQIRANTNGPQPTPYPWTATTDADGRYEIKGMPAGTYTIVGTKPNYVRAAFGADRVEGPGKRMTLADGQVLDTIDLRMQRAGAVTGRIVDEFGDPVTDVFVSAMHYQYIQGSRRLVQAGRGGSTNDIGEYRIFGLSPGQYVVSATLRNINGMNGDSGDRSGYAPTFFPGTGNVGDAQRLAVAAGQTVPAINLTLLPIQTAKVSGSALDADGKPMAGAMISVMQRIGATMVGNSATPIRPDGKFTLNLTPGDYMLRAFGQPGGDSAALDITVNGADIDDLQLVTIKPSTIRGRIAFTESATAAAAPKPTAFDLGAMRDWMVGAPVRSPARIKDDGTFEITLQPGHVLLRGTPTAQQQAATPNATPPWRLNRVIHNGLDVSDSGIDVPANAVVEGVVVEWTNHSNQVSGHVTDADGKTVRDCTVILFSQDPSHWTVQTRYLSVVRPALDDLFHARLLAGDYYAAAMSDVEQNAWTDPDFLAQAREHATKFSIADGETKTIDLPLSPAPVF